MIELFKPFIADEAKINVFNTVGSSLLNQGERVEEFEKGLEEFGLRNPVTVNSCTSALHLALELVGINPGDEVILPAQTFIATGMAVLMARGIPVFADIEKDTGNISTEAIGEKITKRTKAIIVVHWGGYPCDMREIYRVAQGISIIEDAAHAFGAKYEGEFIGNLRFSRFTCFSFQSIKHLTTGDGGCICCRDKRDYFLAKRRRWFGIDKASDLPGPLGERIFDVSKVGFKYHMNDYVATLGISNLPYINMILNICRGNALKYTLRLGEQFQILKYSTVRLSSYWFYSLLVSEPERFIRELRACGIQASIIHTRIDKYKLFLPYNRGKLPGQDFFTLRHVGIPNHFGLSSEEREYIIETILYLRRIKVI